MGAEALVVRTDAHADTSRTGGVCAAREGEADHLGHLLEVDGRLGPCRRRADGPARPRAAAPGGRLALRSHGRAG